MACYIRWGICRRVGGAALKTAYRCDGHGGWQALNGGCELAFLYREIDKLGVPVCSLGSRDKQVGTEPAVRGVRDEFPDRFLREYVTGVRWHWDCRFGRWNER